MILLRSYIIGLIGVGTFYFFQLPLPWLLGPIFASLLAALCNIKLANIKFVSDLMRTILGVAVGATLTVPLLVGMLAIWPSLMMVIFIVFVIGWIGVWYFKRLWKFDFSTSYYGAMPGGLQDMLVFGQEAGGNVRTLSLIHATRVLVIVVAIPVILQFFWQVDLTAPPGAPLFSLNLGQIFWMSFAGIAGWQIAKYFGLFGASILGPLILAGFLSLTEILQHRPPAEAIYMAQFFIGIGVGVKYVGITMAELRRDIFAAFGFTLILGCITLFFFVIVDALHLTEPMNTLLAFAPGGQAEMTVLALIVGADMGFVITHHMLRILVVILGAPIARKFMGSQRSQD